MRVWSKCIIYINIFLCTLIASVIISSRQAAFAVEDPSISISIDNVSMTIIPDSFDSVSQTISASTTNVGGYTIRLENNTTTSSLINTEDSTKTFPTFTIPYGEASLPVASLGYGYGFSVDNGANYSAIPEPNTWTRLFETNSSGNNQHVLTFGAKAPYNIPAGTYTNTFNITIVANLEPCPAESICYHGNKDDETGSMTNQSAPSNDETTLIASNYSRPGYGFAGWNTKLDGSGTNYGPNQTITTGDLSTEGIHLFANWVESTGNLQNWHSCNSLSAGDVIALTDTRDNSSYAIAKYDDDECWMMENLRLNLSNQNVVINSANTNHPANAFATEVNNNHPSPSNSFCETTNAVCIDQIKYNINNIDRNLTAAYDTNDTTSSWYSYGGYYNWYTATAGNGTFSFSTQGATVTGDICPAGWHLPTSNGDYSEYASLDRAYGGNGKSQTATVAGTAASNRWRNYPLNYIFAGEWRAESGHNRSQSGGYHAPEASASQRSLNFWIRPAAINLNQNSGFKYRGQTIRCIADEDYSATGNIHYDANGGTGNMQDDTNVSFNIATAATNTFTKQYFMFESWNTAADGSGITIQEDMPVISAASSLKVPEGGTLTLYAIWKSIYSISYDGNNADAGTMSIVHNDIETNVDLVASNYSRAGYGFAGWSADQSAASKLMNNQSVTIYGPNQNIAMNNELASYADVNNHITLYAVWLPADANDTMQTFDSTKCNALSTGDVLALNDTRDNNTYAIAKLADGNCWMIENMRLDPSTTTFSSANTNSPTTQFITDAPNSSSSNTMCGGSSGDNSTCIDQVAFNNNNLDRSLPASLNSETPSSWYSYGMMYNWYTASAGNGDYAMTSGSVTGDICPTGWRLPTGGTQSEFVQLNNAVNGGSVKNDKALRAFPNNLIYSGDYNQNKSGGRGIYGRLWSATASNNVEAYRLGYRPYEVTPVKAYNKWDAFALRCIVQNVTITNDWFTGF